jgi:hypothetical protein
MVLFCILGLVAAWTMLIVVGGERERRMNIVTQWRIAMRITDEPPVEQAPAPAVANPTAKTPARPPANATAKSTAPVKVAAPAPNARQKPAKAA